MNKGQRDGIRAAKIKDFREKKHWTQKRLAEECSLSRASIAEYESGKQPKLECD